MATLTVEKDVLCTVEDWEELFLYGDDNRYELIEGELFVSTAPRFIHQLLITRLTGNLSEYLKQNPLGEVLAAPGVIFDKNNAVIPDAIFISYHRIKQFLINDKIKGAPELVIEVLSPGRSNIERDRKTKLNLYSRYPVEEYWIVNPMPKQIEVFRSTAHGLRPVEIFNEQDVLISPLFPDFSLSLTELFRN